MPIVNFFFEEGIFLWHLHTELKSASSFVMLEPVSTTKIHRYNCECILFNSQVYMDPEKEVCVYSSQVMTYKFGTT